MNIAQIETVLPTQDVIDICKSANAQSVTLEYWKPKTQAQLVSWLENQYPDNKRFHLMDKAKRWAIFYARLKQLEQGEKNGITR